MGLFSVACMHFNLTGPRLPCQLVFEVESHYCSGINIMPDIHSILAHTVLYAEPSEESLDVYIPSFPGSPRSLSLKDDDDDKERKSIQVPMVEVMQEHEAREQDSILPAAEIGDSEAIKRLIQQKVDINVKDHLGRNALHFAVQNGDMAAIEMLLAAGIDATLKDDVGMTPLMLCLMRNPSLRVCKLLFEHGVVILPRSKPMDTGLFIQFVMMCTPTSEDAEILRLLVEKGALVDDPKAPGLRQALHFAAMSNNCDLIRILIDLGADLQARNHRNETPKDVAISFHCKEAAALLALVEETGVLSTTVKSDTVSPEANTDKVTSVNNANTVTPGTNTDTVKPVTKTDTVSPVTKADTVTPGTNADTVTPGTNADTVSPVTGNVDEVNNKKDVSKKPSNLDKSNGSKK